MEGAAYAARTQPKEKELFDDPTRNFAGGLIVYALLAQCAVIATLHYVGDHQSGSWATANALADPIGMTVQLALLLALIMALGNFSYLMLATVAVFNIVFGLGLADYKPTHEYGLGWIGFALSFAAIVYMDFAKFRADTQRAIQAMYDRNCT
jgi:hypothetical protein